MADIGFDIFNSDGFSMTSLTNAVNKSPYVPNYLARLGLFEESGVNTTTVWIEEDNGTVVLVPTVPRNGAPVNNTPDRRTMRSLTIPCLKLEDDINADEVQNIRAFGSMALQTAEMEVAKRQRRMNNNIEATLEFHRMGALKGIVYDADGSTALYNLYTIFNKTQDIVEFDLDVTSTLVLNKCTTVRNNIQNELGSLGGDDIEVLALCSPSFWEAFITHDAVTDAYMQWRAGMAGYPSDPITQDLRYKGFNFGGVRFQVYRGSVTGTAGTAVPYIPTDTAYAFPINVPGLFHTNYGPATFLDTVNQPGLPRYSRMLPDPSGRNEKITVHLQSNPVSYCTRPMVVQKLELT